MPDRFRQVGAIAKRPEAPVGGARDGFERIYEQQAAFRAAGGRFRVPPPVTRIVG